MTGAGQAGQTETCQNAEWATWAGTTVSLSLFGFDGFQWLRDGAPINGQRGPTYVPQNTDIGHQLSCRVTVTYPVPFLASTSAQSGSITVQAAAPTPPSPSPPSPPSPSKALDLSGLSVSPGSFAITGRKVKGRCVGLTHANRKNRRCHRTVALSVSFKLTVAARVTFTIKQSTTGRKVNGRCVRVNRSNRKKRHCVRVTQLKGSVALNGTAGTNRFRFNGKRAGARLGPAAIN